MVLPYQQHQKLRQSIQKLQSSSSSNLDILKDKPFWIWDKDKHLLIANETNQQCCFNHIVGLPVNQKTGLPNPMFDYEKILYDALVTKSENKHKNKQDPFKDKHLWVKKATGLGVTEFMLRFMA
jgi:hypothetical protein